MGEPRSNLEESAQDLLKEFEEKEAAKKKLKKVPSETVLSTLIDTCVFPMTWA